MEKIYSKIKKNVVLVIINRYNEITNKRADLTPPEEFLQVSCFAMHKGKTFKAHKHREQKKGYNYHTRILCGHERKDQSNCI